MVIPKLKKSCKKWLKFCLLRDLNWGLRDIIANCIIITMSSLPNIHNHCHQKITVINQAQKYTLFSFETKNYFNDYLDQFDFHLTQSPCVKLCHADLIGCLTGYVKLPIKFDFHLTLNKQSPCVKLCLSAKKYALDKCFRELKIKIG